MNCEPGDIARIVGQTGFEAHLNDKIVRVTRLSDRPWPHPCWLYEGPPLRTALGPITALADKELRPIRDPGDDAVDEMVRRVGSAPCVEDVWYDIAGDIRQHNRTQWP